MNEKRFGRMTGVLLGAMFLLMLVLNILTPKMADDFAYSYSFATREPLTNVFQIFPSLLAHAQNMNGRLFAHFFAQLFLMLPGGIFDVVNALVFVGQTYLIYRITLGRDRQNPLLLLALFGAAWVFTPAFGQVNLWLDGACNYLWCTAFGLLFLLPYADAFLLDKHIESKPLQALFFPFAILAGGFLENGSAAVFGMSVLLLLLIRFIGKQRPKTYLIFGSLGAFLGYLSIYLAPAEWANKSTAFSLSVLADNFTRALEMYKELAPLLIALAVLLTLALLRKTDKKRIWLALVFVAGSLAANFMLTFAGYYPERCASSCVIFLLAADGILLQSLWQTSLREGCAALLSVVLLLFSYGAVTGSLDILRVDRAIARNAAYIEECKAAGEMNVTLPMVAAKTKYCALYDLKYLGTEVPEDWPNVSMAMYYGIDSVIGTW